MSRFHKPRLSSAIILSLFCINSSFASPVAIAERSRVSIVAAYEPVQIISAEDLPADLPFPSGGGSSTTTVGDEQLTTYNLPRDVVRVKPPTSIASAVQPVHVIPIDALPSGQVLRGGSSTSTNDGTTLTTTFSPQEPASRKRVNLTNSLELLSSKNQSLVQSEVNMGLNCDGSVIMCVGAAQMGVMHTLRDYMYAIPHGYRYYAGQKIACMKHNVYPNPWITWGFYCAFMQGNVSTEGEDGAVIQLKMQQMIEHHCLGCGSVPFSPDNDPNTLGILTVNYVRQSECEGLCYYVPPGTDPNAAGKVPHGMTLASS